MTIYAYTECHYPQSLLCLLSVTNNTIMLNVVMLNVGMLNVVMLNVVAPAKTCCSIMMTIL